jgi:hypothetical protein
LEQKSVDSEGLFTVADMWYSETVVQLVIIVLSLCCNKFLRISGADVRLETNETMRQGGAINAG